MDYERAARLLLKELRDGILGSVTLEAPDDPSRWWPCPEEQGGVPQNEGE